MDTWFLRWRIIVLPKSYIPALFCSLTSALLFSFPSTNRQLHNEDVLEHSDNLHLFPEPFCTTPSQQFTSVRMVISEYSFKYPMYITFWLHMFNDMYCTTGGIYYVLSLCQWKRPNDSENRTWYPWCGTLRLTQSLCYSTWLVRDWERWITAKYIVCNHSSSEVLWTKHTEVIYKVDFFWAEYIGANTKEWRNSHMREVNRTLWDW